MKLLTDDEKDNLKKDSKNIFLLTEKELIIFNKIISIEINTFNYNKLYNYMIFDLKFYLGDGSCSTTLSFNITLNSKIDLTENISTLKVSIYKIVIKTLNTIKENEQFEKFFIKNIQNDIYFQ